MRLGLISADRIAPSPWPHHPSGRTSLRLVCLMARRRSTSLTSKGHSSLATASKKCC